MNEQSFERRILWYDEDEPTPPPPGPISVIDGLIPTGIGIWGVLAVRPGPGDDLRVPAARVTFSFAPVAPVVPPTPSPTPFGGQPPTLDALISVGIGIWGALHGRPGPGDDLRIPAVRPTYSFDPAIAATPPPPARTPFSGHAPALDALTPVGIGIWGSLQTRPQPGDALR